MNSRKARLLTLAVIVLTALFFRVRDLGRVGLSEDEANKILAAESYRNGDFTPNSEHPMLMKLLCTGSVLTAEWMNRALGTRISPEASLRFPVALIGALSAISIYLLAVELLNPASALIAAALWATDINAIALTRIAKEDPLVAFFFLLGSWALLKGKRLHFDDRNRANRYYLACGAFFGMMFASKYLIPIIWIPLIYYDTFRFGTEPRWRIDRKIWLRIIAVFALFFLLCNPVVLSPELWGYLWKHFTHKRLAHNGYLFMDNLELNKTYYTFWGTPAYFFPLYLWVKTSWPLLVMFFLGLLMTLRRIRDARFFFLGLYFLLWLFLLTLPGGKFTRYAATLLPAVILLQALGMYIFYSGIRNHFKKQYAPTVLASCALAGLLCGSAGWSVYQDFQHHPYYSLYVAWQGGGEARRGFYFPQDDFYDAGLREAIGWISRTAPRENLVLGTTPAVFRYYTGVFGRRDLRFQSTVDKTYMLNLQEASYVLYQHYRTYLENRYLMTFFRAELRPLYQGMTLNKEAITVYRLCKSSDCARAEFWTGRWPGRLRALGR